MNEELEYPLQVVVPDGAFSQLVRISTAIHAACIDTGGAFFGVEFTEDELEDFFKTNAHRYFQVKPRGAIGTAAKRLTKAVLESIKKGSLILDVVRVNLDDEVCLPNSWVSFFAFEEWCDSRSIVLGESWLELLNDQKKIIEMASLEVQNCRKILERPSSAQDIAKVTKEFENEGLDAAVLEILSLRAKLEKSKINSIEAEKPLAKRERDSLLTIIAALCQDAKFDHNKSAKTAGLIQSTAAKMGVSIGETTIEEHLKKIPHALATRMK